MLVIRLAIFWFAILIGVVGLLLVQRMIGEPTHTAVVEVRVQARSEQAGRQCSAKKETQGPVQVEGARV
jgi:hypothetical protein